VGILALAVLAAALIQTGRGWLAYAMLAVALLTAGLLVLEYTVVTPAEEVEAALDQLARDLETSDVEAVVRHISERAPALRDEARRALERVVISSVRIKPNLKIAVLADRNPPFAEAKFNAVARLRDKAGQFVERPQAYFFVVTLRKENGVWRVRRYEMHDPLKGLR
jgi:hypothetical protein